MEKGAIHAIIEVEKDIQKKIKAEERKSRETIEKLRKETESHVNKEEQRFHQELERAIDAARQEAVKKAEKMVEDAAVRATHIEGLDDNTLKKVLLKYIHRLLPETQ